MGRLVGVFCRYVKFLPKIRYCQFVPDLFTEKVKPHLCEVESLRDIYTRTLEYHLRHRDAGIKRPREDASLDLFLVPRRRPRLRGTKVEVAHGDRIDTEERVTSLCCSAKYIATGHTDNIVRVWCAKDSMLDPRM